MPKDKMIITTSATKHPDDGGKSKGIGGSRGFNSSLWSSGRSNGNNLWDSSKYRQGRSDAMPDATNKKNLKRLGMLPY